MQVEHWTVSSQQELEDAFEEMGFVVGDSYIEGARGAYFAADERQSEMASDNSFIFLDFNRSVKTSEIILRKSNGGDYGIVYLGSSKYLQIYKLNLYGGGVIIQAYGTSNKDQKTANPYSLAILPKGDSWVYFAKSSNLSDLIYDQGEGTVTNIKNIKTTDALTTPNSITFVKSYNFNGGFIDAEVYQLLYSPSIAPNTPFVFDADGNKYIATISSESSTGAVSGDRLVFRLSDEY